MRKKDKIFDKFTGLRQTLRKNVTKDFLKVIKYLKNLGNFIKKNYWKSVSQDGGLLINFLGLLMKFGSPLIKGTQTMSIKSFKCQLDYWQQCQQQTQVFKIESFSIGNDFTKTNINEEMLHIVKLVKSLKESDSI